MTVKEAVNQAKSLANDFLSDESVSGYQLEEVVFNEVQGIWEITIGYYTKDAKPPSGGLMETMDQISGNRRFERKYKVFRIDNRDGSFISMRMREL